MVHKAFLVALLLLLLVAPVAAQGLPPCPTPQPYWGTVTPSTGWMAYCSHCAPTPTPTPTVTPTVEPGQPTHTPVPTSSPTPTITPTSSPLLTVTVRYSRDPWYELSFRCRDYRGYIQTFGFGDNLLPDTPYTLYLPALCEWDATIPPIGWGIATFSVAPQVSLLGDYYSRTRIRHWQTTRGAYYEYEYSGVTLNNYPHRLIYLADGTGWPDSSRAAWGDMLLCPSSDPCDPPALSPIASPTPALSPDTACLLLPDPPSDFGLPTVQPGDCQDYGWDERSLTCCGFSVTLPAFYFRVCETDFGVLRVFGVSISLTVLAVLIAVSYLLRFLRTL